MRMMMMCVVVIQIYFIMVFGSTHRKNPFIIPAGILIFAALSTSHLNDVYVK